MNLNKSLVDKLSKWYAMNDELKALKDAESKLRKEIIEESFRDRKEGTNNMSLPDNWVAKCKQPYTRKIDPVAFDAIKTRLRDNGVVCESVVKWKPELIKKGYDALSDKQRLIFSDCLIEKPGSASLEITLPKKYQKD